MEVVQVSIPAPIARLCCRSGGVVVSYGRSGGRQFLETEPNVEYENPLIRPGMDAMAARAAEADADPARPVYHFRPPSGWMNDVNGPLLHQGYYHIFYQLNPYRTDGRYGTHWGHARSRDLVHWEHLPLAVWPSTELGESSCYSGTAGFDANGRPIILYTSTKRWGPRTDDLGAVRAVGGGGRG